MEESRLVRMGDLGNHSCYIYNRKVENEEYVYRRDVDHFSISNNLLALNLRSDLVCSTDGNITMDSAEIKRLNAQGLKNVSREENEVTDVDA